MKSIDFYRVWANPAPAFDPPAGPLAASTRRPSRSPPPRFGPPLFAPDGLFPVDRIHSHVG